MRRRRALNKQERLEKIMLAIAGLQQQERLEWVTVAQIARSMDMTPSTHLRKLVNELADCKFLARIETETGVGCIKKSVQYRLERSDLLSATLPTIPRQIALNIRGKREVVQL